MKFELTKKMGSTQIKLMGECEDQLKFFRAASFVSDIPDICGHCQSTNLRFLFRTPKGYEYASIECLDCHYELKYGQHKEGNTLFAKGWEPPYENKEPNEERENQPRRDQAQPNGATGFAPQRKSTW